MLTRHYTGRLAGSPPVSRSVRAHMRMFAYALLLILQATVSQAAGLEPFPVPHNVKTIEKIEKNIDGWRGKVLGFTGLVEEIHVAYQEKPSVRILLPNPNPDRKFLWVSSLVKLEGSDLAVGNTIRVVGYLDRLPPDDITAEYNHTGYHLLGFCMVNQEKKKGYFLPVAIIQCERWQSGDSPETLAHE